MTNKIQELTVNEAWRDEQDAWNHRSEYFVEMHNREDRKAQVTEFLAFLKDENLLPPAGGRTLDVGCGVCDYALGLAREGYQATGIDLSDGMIRGAKQLAESEGLDLSLYIGPWSDETRGELGWDKTFDLAYSSSVLLCLKQKTLELCTMQAMINACGLLSASVATKW